MISRTTNYGGFQSYGDKPVPVLKPGQQQLDRTYYNSVVNSPGDSYLSSYGRLNSNYSSSIADPVKPQDYTEQPRLPIFDKNGKSNYTEAPVEEKNPHMTSHWGSVYSQEFSQKGISRASRPEWSLPQAPHQVRMPSDFYWKKNNN